MGDIYLFKNYQSRIEKMDKHFELRLSTEYSKSHYWLLEIPLDFMTTHSCIYENIMKNLTLDIHSVDTLCISSKTDDEKYGSIIHAVEETIKLSEGKEIDINEEYTDISVILNIKFYNTESGDLVLEVDPSKITLNKDGSDSKKIELHESFKPIPIVFENYQEIVRLLEYIKKNIPTL